MRGTTTLDREVSRERSRKRPGRVRWTRRGRILSAIIGCLLTGGAAFAASTWLVGLSAGSSGQGEGGSVSNLTITAAASPSPAGKLYPGNSGDAVITISNPNSFGVTVTGLTLPSSTTYATGYSDSALTTPNACTSALSYVGWSYAATPGSHTLSTPVTVAANGSLTVTLTGDATMGTSSDNSCQNTYFKLPSFTAVAATVATGAATASPATSGWTS